MAIALPPPKVPGLGPDNAIDLDDLGSADLETYIDYPGIAEGDQFWPNWRGCGPLGDVVDQFENLVTINPGDLRPEGMPISIANDLLVTLDQGWVFYSYQMDDPSQPDNRGEESLRRFFYVGKRPSMTTQLLPAPQFKESHDLCVDLSLVEAGGATIVTLPYQAMSAGDVVTFTMKMFFYDGFPWDDFIRTKTLTELDIGQPLQWTVPRNELEIIDGGSVQLSYGIVYATPTVSTPSAEQTLRIVTPVTSLLPPLEIKGFSGDMLDPEAHPDGITLSIKLYPGISVGDDLVVYALGDTRVIKVLRVDPSTIDGEILEIHLEYEWLAANNGKLVSLMYQYARVGSAGTSKPLSLMLRVPLYLPHPIVEGVIPDGDPDEYKGYLLARSTTGGVYIRIPDDAVIGADDGVQMIWEGYGHLGNYIADPTAGNPRRFYIPPQFVPANLGKRLRVFYRVTPPGEEPFLSKVYNLEIKDMESGWPTLQIETPVSPGNRVSLATVPPDGVTFRLGSWTFMAEGQRVKIYAKGLLSDDDKEEIINLREGEDEEVTEDEFYAGELYSKLRRDFLERLKVGLQFDVFVETSFDEGFSYKAFPMISPQLIA